jgi:hypothetical protein
MSRAVLTAGALAVLLILAASAGAQTQPGAATAQSASGFGQVHLGLPFRNFAFSATKHEDGTVTGQAQLQRRDLGVYVHVDIDCLTTFGDIAVMSGVVARTNSPFLPVGFSQLLAVEDNGEGPGAAPDQITMVFDGLGIACTDLPPDPAIHAPFLFPVEHGQIQVRP